MVSRGIHNGPGFDIFVGSAPVQPLAKLLLLLRRFSRVRLCATPQTAALQAPRPWDSPGKNTGVGCHFLLQCMKVKSESEAAQSCPTLSDPMDCSLPGYSVHGIFQARVLEWGASCPESLIIESFTFILRRLGKHQHPHVVCAQVDFEEFEL